MKTRQYLESFVKQGYKAHASMFYEVNGKKYKFTYDHGNAYEYFKIELFDGTQLNLIATRDDMNVDSVNCPYLMTETQTKNRVATLMEAARKYVETLETI